MTSILIAVTGGSIAHTLRPLPIALRLRRLGARVVFGGTGPYVRFLEEQGFPVVPLPMLDYGRVCKMMDSERFHLRGLAEYRSAVAAQRCYLDGLKPDLVLQDGPDPALPLAAFEAGIEHVSLANATVFGFAGPQQVVPYRPWLRNKIKWSEKLTYWINNFLILQRNVRVNIPMFTYLAQRGIAVESIYQPALIPDLPELFGAPPERDGKIFIGPLLYEPEVPKPEWWSKLDHMRPLVYVGVGSSGGLTGMRTMIEALADTEYQVVLSTADTFKAQDLPQNFFASGLVPREAVLQRAAVMVFHGGNATMYQGIKFGVPMVAIPAHFDHEMNARAVVARGLGISIYPHELTPYDLRHAVDTAMRSSKMAFNLKRFQMVLTKRNAAEEGARLVLEYAGRGHARNIGWFPSLPVEFEEVQCDLCGNTNGTQTAEASSAGKQKTSTVQCKKCSLTYCSPRPTQSSLWLLEPLEHNLNHSAPTRAQKAQVRRKHKAELRAIKRFVKLDLQSRVLVVGCRAGDFARFLLENVGCEILCVEENPALLRQARARGLWVREDLGRLSEKDTGFDLILFLDSLERMPSPQKALGLLRERTAPSGSIVIRTPRSPDQIDVPRALYSFTPETLESLLRQNGFGTIRNMDDRRGKDLWCTAAPGVK